MKDIRQRPQTSERASSSRTVSRAWAAGSILALIILAAYSRGDIDRTAYGDGAIVRYVAANMTIETDEVHPVVVDRGTSLRYGRIGLPAAIWLVSAGQEGAIPYAHAALIIFAAGAASAAAVALVPGWGISAGVLPWIAPGFALSVSGGFADAVAVPLGLWATVFALRGRWPAAIVTLSAGMLVKEGVVVLLAGLGLWFLLQRRVSIPVILGVSLLPVVAWYLVVRERFGHIPILDPYLDDFDGHAGTPVLAFLRSLRDPPHASGLVTALVHLGLAAIPAALFRTSCFAIIGSVAGLQVLAAGPFAWEFIGEAARVFVVLQVFTILALVAWKRPAVVLPASLGFAPGHPPETASRS